MSWTPSTEATVIAVCPCKCNAVCGDWPLRSTYAQIDLPEYLHDVSEMARMLCATYRCNRLCRERDSGADSAYVPRGVQALPPHPPQARPLRQDSYRSYLWRPAPLPHDLFPQTGYQHQHNTAGPSCSGSRPYSTSLSLGSKESLCDMNESQCNQTRSVRLAETGRQACSLCMPVAVTCLMFNHASPSGLCSNHYAKPQFWDWTWKRAAADYCPPVTSQLCRPSAP